MSFILECRKYQRCETIMNTTLMSVHGECWQEIDICDISAGGLKFVFSKQLEENALLKFDICIRNMLSEFTIQLEGNVVRKEQRNGGSYYAVKFYNPEKYVQIQLDEIIKSKISLSAPGQHAADDGTYTFFLIPKVRTSRLNLAGLRPLR